MSRLSKGLYAGLITGVLGLIISLTPFGIDLEERIGLELLFKMRGARQAPSDVVIVTLDEESARRLNLSDEPEKWPRSLHAELVNILVKKGASVIAFDIIFDDPQSIENDNLFAEAIHDARNVVLCESINIKKHVVSLADKTSAQIERLVRPIEPFAQSAAALAPFPLPKVPVKVSQYWTFKKSAGDVATLPVVVFQLFALEMFPELISLLKREDLSLAKDFPKDKYTLISHKSVRLFIRHLRNLCRERPNLFEKMLDTTAKEVSLPVDTKRYNILKSLINMHQSPDSRYLNFYGPPGTITTIPYHFVLDNQDDSTVSQKQIDFNNKAVFIGLSERFRPTRKDGFHTVFSQSSGVDISGVEIAATAFANLVENMPVQPLNLGIHLTIVFLWGLTLGILCRFFTTAVPAACLAVMSLIYFVVSANRFAHTGVWYPLVIPLFIQGPFAFFGTVLWKYYDTNKERQNIRRAFGYYLPNRIVDQLSKNMGDITTSSQTVYGTCLFTDAGQYTTLSETMKPEELSRFMNKYYEILFEPVRDNGGTVINVVGDSMLAVWATALPDAGFRRRACVAALEIHNKINRFNQSYQTSQLPTRIGLHAGQMMLGNIGAGDHFEYRPVGDIVNTASRMEGLNKYLGTDILVSEEVLYQLDDFVIRELGKFVLVGRTKPTTVYELLCRKDALHPQIKDLCNTFSEALCAYRKQSWMDAIDRFHEAMKIKGLDGPSHFYLDLCKKYREFPPDENWDGIVRLDEK
jgi:adenylate cyclase